MSVGVRSKFILYLKETFMGLLLLSPTLFLQMNCSCYAPVQAWQALTAQYNTWVKRAAFAWQMLYHTQSVRQQNLSHGCSVIGKVCGFHTGVKRARDLAAYLNQISRAMGSRRQRFRVYQPSNHKGTAVYEEITGKMGKKTQLCYHSVFTEGSSKQIKPY